MIGRAFILFFHGNMDEVALEVRHLVSHSRADDQREHAAVAVKSGCMSGEGAARWDARKIEDAVSHNQDCAGTLQDPGFD